MTTIYIPGTSATIVTEFFPDPGNWNPVNTVEIVAAGARGGVGLNSNNGGGGGGGGSYAKGTNIVPASWPAPYVVCQGGSLNHQFNNFNADTTQQPASGVNNVTAECGVTGSNLAGGPGGFTFRPSGFGGGTAGNATGTGTDRGGGGGGGAGPGGVGNNGTDAVGTVAGSGGSGNAGLGGTGGGPGVAGGTSTTFDSTHGVGGGGGGSILTAPGAAGGSYGGGGGGGSSSGSSANRQGGIGGSGLIIITYTPLAAPKGGLGFNMPMGGL